MSQPPHPLPPPWLLAATLGLSTWAVWYVGAHHGGFSARICDGDTDAPPLVQMGAASDFERVQRRGRRLFAACAACHQPDGLGVPGLYPALDQSPWVADEAAGLARIVLGGLRDPGQPEAMPAWRQYSDAQLAAIVTYVQARWGTRQAAVSTDLIADIRRATADRRQPWTRAELGQ